MSQRNSGYERIARDEYSTPEWVTEALLPHLPPPPLYIWEPACGSGKMVRVLARVGDVVGTDIAVSNNDFLSCIATAWHRPFDAIITNPPYVLAQEFIEHALKQIATTRGMAAMLLRTDFDHAKGRQHLFSNCVTFAKKLVLTRRIKWFEDSKGQPSFNHAWYVWNFNHTGAPTLAYGP